jgi:hypothetical protein
MDCHRAEELLSDHLEGTLHEILRTEVERHLASCPACAELRQALAEVVAALHAYPELEPGAGLAERCARAALLRPRLQARVHPAPADPIRTGPGVPVRPAIEVPSWIQAAAAGLALIALGTMLMVLGPEKPTRAAQRIVSHTVTAGSQLMERKDRLFEDVRLLGVVLTTAFEGRVDRVNERVEDYRRLLERRRATPPSEPKQGSQTSPLSIGIASTFRTAPPGSA